MFMLDCNYPGFREQLEQHQIFTRKNLEFLEAFEKHGKNLSRTC
jgi:hypothetical protein